MHTPLVSIVVPAYNASSFLPTTIESVIAQTYQNWEMLIVDDGSPDNTLSIAKSYSARDSRIRVFSLGYNSGGPATPRNYGIKNAKGDYLAFLDYDDLWLPEKLQKQVAFLENNKDVFWVYSKYIIEKDGKRIKAGPDKPYSGDVFKALILHSNVVPILTVIIRNKKNGKQYFFDEDPRLVAVEDYAMWLSIARNEKIAFINEPLAIYRAHSKGIASRAFSNFKKCKIVLQKFSHFVPRPTLALAYFNFYRISMFYGIIDVLIQAKKTLRKILGKTGS